MIPISIYTMLCTWYSRLILMLNPCFCKTNKGAFFLSSRFNLFSMPYLIKSSWYWAIELGIKTEQFFPITSLIEKLVISWIFFDVLIISPSLFCAKEIMIVQDFNKDFYIFAAFSVFFFNNFLIILRLYFAFSFSLSNVKYLSVGSIQRMFKNISNMSDSSTESMPYFINEINETAKLLRSFKKCYPILDSS